MGTFNEIGILPGQVLPAPSIVAPRNDMVYGADGTWRYIPGAHLATDLGKTYTGNGVANPETDILNGAAAITGLFPAGVAVGDSYRQSARGRFANSAASNITSTLKFYFGAFVALTGVSANVNSRTAIWGIDYEVILETLGAGGVAKIRVLITKRFGINTVFPNGTGTVAATAAGQFEEDEALTSGTNANLQTAVANDFRVTATHSTNANTMATTLNLCRSHYYPKGY